jgi:hypothetical protein
MKRNVMTAIFWPHSKECKSELLREMNAQSDDFGHCGMHHPTNIKCNFLYVLSETVQCKNMMVLSFLRKHSSVHGTQYPLSTDYHFGIFIRDISEVQRRPEYGPKHTCMSKK